MIEQKRGRSLESGECGVVMKVLDCERYGNLRGFTR